MNDSVTQAKALKKINVALKKNILFNLLIKIFQSQRWMGVAHVLLIFNTPSALRMWFRQVSDNFFIHLMCLNLRGQNLKFCHFFIQALIFWLMFYSLNTKARLSPLSQQTKLPQRFRIYNRMSFISKTRRKYARGELSIFFLSVVVWC